MTKKKSPVVLPEEKEPAHDISLYVTGEYIPVEVGTVTVYIRQPLYIERDQADFQESLFSRNIEVENEEIAFLSESPAPKKELERLRTAIKQREALFESETDDVRKRVMNERINFMYQVVDGRDASEALLERFSSRAKMRWYAKTLVVDKDGLRLDYNSMHPAVQDMILTAIESMMEDIDTLPLELV